MLNYLKKSIHISWLITAVCLGILLGVATTRLGKMSWPNWLVVVGMVLALTTAISRLRLMVPLAVLAGLMIGLARGSDRLAQLSLYDRYLGGQVTIVAKVDGDPTLSHGLVAVKLTDISIAKEGATDTMVGTIWASLVNVQLEQVDRLDRIKLVGTLDEGFGAYAAVVSEATVLEIDTSNNILNIQKTNLTCSYIL